MAQVVPCVFLLLSPTPPINMAAMKATKAGKAMKANKVMKTMKAMKVMKSKIANGKLAKVSVFKGRKVKTVGGLKKSDLKKNSEGKIVSKRRSASSKKNFQNSPLKKWGLACSRARKALGLKGFVPCKKGSAFYKKAQELLK